MNDCIFCKIINNEIPSKTIHEDELVKVIMSIDPVTNGHLLIKDKLYPLLKEKLNCDGLTISENNFLGQEIKHFHIHLIPRYKDDNIDFNIIKENINDLDEVFNNLTK